MWKMRWLDFAFKNKLAVNYQGAWMDHDGFKIRINAGYYGLLKFRIFIKDRTSIHPHDIEAIFNKSKCCKFKKIHEDHIEFKYWSPRNKSETDLRKTLDEVVQYLKSMNVSPIEIETGPTHFIQESQIKRCEMIAKADWLRLPVLVVLFGVFQAGEWVSGKYFLGSGAPYNIYMTISLSLTLLLGTIIYLFLRKKKGLLWFIFSGDDFNVNAKWTMSLVMMMIMRFYWVATNFNLIYECVKYYASISKQI